MISAGALTNYISCFRAMRAAGDASGFFRAYSSDREQSFHAMVNGARSGNWRLNFYVRCSRSRPGRGAHDALDALAVGIMDRKVNCDNSFGSESMESLRELAQMDADQLRDLSATLLSQLADRDAQR